MSRKMIVGMHFGNGYGSQPGAWQMAGVDPRNYTNFDNQVRYAHAAERGKLHFLFVPDFPALKGDIETEAPQITLDPMMTLAAVARGTSRIGLVATGTATFNEPYHIARQFRALDLMSHGRAGWNAVPTSDPAIDANYGRQIPPRLEKYARLHESIQIVQGLWGSWERDAWIHDAASGRFANPSKIQAINMRGAHVGSRGPLPLPPSEQGQPVIFQAGGGDLGLEVAGRYASGVIGATFTIEHACEHRNALRAAAERSGRDPDEVKFFAGLMMTIGADKRAALDRRIVAGGRDLSQQVSYLGQMLGLRLGIDQVDQPLTHDQLRGAYPNPGDPRSDTRSRLLVMAGPSGM